MQMQGPQSPQENLRQISPSTLPDKKSSIKYTANQFYPKSKSKLTPNDFMSPTKTKNLNLRAVNKSAFSQSINDKQSRFYINSELHDLKLRQSYNGNNQKSQQNSSFTMKIIDHHMQRGQESNLIGKQSLQIGTKSPQKFRSRLYQEIEMINNNEQRIKAINEMNIMNPKGSSRKQSLMINFQMPAESTVSQLYKSLPQPFINKKQLSSFQPPINYLKTREQKKQQQRLRLSQQRKKQLRLLQINNMKSPPPNETKNSVGEMMQELTKYSSDFNQFIQSGKNKNYKKKKKLQPLKASPIREKMSNNIKDYLSVERINIKEIQNHLLQEIVNNQTQKEKGEKLVGRMERQNQSNQLLMPRLSQSPTKTLSRKSVTKPYSTVGTLPRARPIKFLPPFPLYYYRDFIWKIAFSNEQIVESPQDYDTKVKVYLGKGNNSNLIKGLIKRRPWYQITDKYQEAHFVWTQIKMQQCFGLQKKSQKTVEFQSSQCPIAEESKKTLVNQTLNQLEKVRFLSYWTKNVTKEMKFKQSLKPRSNLIGLKQVPLSQVMSTTKIHNHFVNNYVIGNKKALFSLMSKYYIQKGEQPFNYLPLTFHIKNSLEDDQYLKFLNYYYSISKEIKKMEESELNSYIYKHNAWIVKPGENTNRGNGIIVCLTLNEVKAILKKKEKHNDGTNKTYILQKYIEKPLLYKKRKFDLRHYMMMSCTNGIVKGYWYKDGYVRTTSTEYTLKFNSGGVHLTNDAVQKQLPDYGKYEKGNKISYEQLNDYIKKSNPEFDFTNIILTKMKKIATDLTKASARLMDPQKRENNFEIFGLDFMIDEAYNVWLIECNSNPCLELSCPLLGRIIPKMVENVFRICLDPVFVPPLSFAPKSQEYSENVNEANHFQLVYDERNDEEIRNQEKSETNELLDNKDFQQDDDTFDDDGEDWDD